LAFAVWRFGTESETPNYNIGAPFLIRDE
jgi:hypothetical protein